MEKWEHIICAYESSGMSASQYCKSVELSLSRFYYWHRKLRRIESESNGFLKISTKINSQISYEIEYPNGVKLRLLGDITLAELQLLVHV